MEIAEQRSVSDGKVWGFLKLPFLNSSNGATASSSSSTSQNFSYQNSSQRGHLGVLGSSPHPAGSISNSSVTSVARSLLPRKRRLRLDPPNKLYFPYEPGKQVKSAIRIKNICKAYVAFKFQTTAPKSCFMRPPGAILAPGESLVVTVFKFVEHPEKNEKAMDVKCKVKFKIMSLKVEGAMDYLPELFEEHKEQTRLEQILDVVFVEMENPSVGCVKALEKLKCQLAEAEAEVEARKKQVDDAGPKIIGEGLVIDEWKERRERYLARQQLQGVDSP